MSAWGGVPAHAGVTAAAAGVGASRWAAGAATAAGLWAPTGGQTMQSIAIGDACGASWPATSARTRALASPITWERGGCGAAAVTAAAVANLHHGQF